MQAHFDAALSQFREEERQSLEWKQDPQTLAYLDAMDKVEIRMAERYLRDPVRNSPVPIFVLSTQAADELDIRHLCDYVMNVPAGQVVGEASCAAGGRGDRGGSSRGSSNCSHLAVVVESAERICLFTYLQKVGDEFYAGRLRPSKSKKKRDCVNISCDNVMRMTNMSTASPWATASRFLQIWV